MEASQYRSYQEYLKDLIELRKSTDPEFTSTKLADQAQIQRSYLSRVLHGRANLSADQLYQVCKLLSVSKADRKYLELLLEIERCAVPERRYELDAEAEAYRTRRARSESHLEAQSVAPAAEAFSKYYTDPYCPIVHMFLTIPQYLADPYVLKERLQISSAKLTQVLASLEECRVIARGKKGYELLEHRMHLSADSHFLKPYATQFRLKAIDFQHRQRNENDYFFTASFSANDEIRAEARAKFLELLKWLSERLSSVEPNDVYHINFDLFRL